MEPGVSVISFRRIADERERMPPSTPSTQAEGCGDHLLFGCVTLHSAVRQLGGQTSAFARLSHPQDRRGAEMAFVSFDTSVRWGSLSETTGGVG